MATATAPQVRLNVEFDREEDGRWIAEIPALPGVLVYGDSQEDAERKVKALALRVLADKMEDKTEDNFDSFRFAHSA